MVEIKRTYSKTVMGKLYERFVIHTNDKQYNVNIINGNSPVILCKTKGESITEELNCLPIEVLEPFNKFIGKK